MNAGEAGKGVPNASSVGNWFDLKNAAAALSAFTFFAYFVGWEYAKGYLRTFGAAWAIEFMGAGDFVRFAGPLLTSIAGSVLGTVLFILIGYKRTTIQRINTVLILSGAVTQFAGLMPTRFLTLVWQERLTTVGLSLFVVSIGMWIVEWFWDFRRDERRLSPERALSAHWLIVFSCAGLPWLSGSTAAARDEDPVTSELPAIWRCGAADNGWRLVTQVGERALIVKLGEPRLFRLVAPSDGWFVTYGKTAVASSCEGQEKNDLATGGVG